MSKQKAAISVVTAGVLWGIISIFIRALSAAGLDALQITSVRTVVSAVVFTLAAALSDPKKLRIRLRDIWMFIGTGIVSVVLFNCCYFYTMVKSQASVAVVLLYTSPVFVVLISAALFKERITLRKLAALAITVVGCVFVAGLIGGQHTITPLILLTGLGAGFFYALYTIFGRIALKRYDTMTVTAYTFIFAAAGSLPLSRFGAVVNAAVKTPSLLLWYVGIGIVCTVLPYLLYTRGLQSMESGRAAILAAVEPLVGALLGMVFYGDSRGALKITGIALIILAILILSTGGEKKLKTDLKRQNQ